MAVTNDQYANAIDALPPQPDSPLDYINTTDFRDEAQVTSTGDLGASTYFPGATLSPGQLQFQPGRYFAALPVATGNAFLLPFGVADARMKALQQAALVKQKEAKKQQDAIWNTFRMVQGEPQYQGKLNQRYKDEIFSGIEDLYRKHGKNATTILSDPNNKETQELLGKYLEYEAYNRGVSGMKAQIDELHIGQANGYVPSPEAWKVINKYYNGGMKMDDFKTAPQKLRSVMTLDKWFDGNKKNITQAVTSYYQKGVPVFDANGKPQLDKNGNQVMMRGANGDVFVNQLKKTFLDDKSLDAIVATAKASGQVDPTITDADFKSYLKAMLPDQLESAFHDVNNAPVGNGGAGTGADKTLTWVMDDAADYIGNKNTWTGTNSGGGTDVHSNFLKGFVIKGADGIESKQINSIVKIHGLNYLVFEDQINDDGTFKYSEIKANGGFKDSQLWNTAIVPAVNGTYGTGAIEKLDKLKDYMIANRPAEARKIGVPIPVSGTATTPQPNAAPANAAPVAGAKQIFAEGPATFDGTKWVLDK